MKSEETTVSWQIGSQAGPWQTSQKTKRKNVVNALIELYFPVMGLCASIQCDNGSEFKNQLVVSRAVRVAVSCGAKKCKLRGGFKPTPQSNCPSRDARPI